MLQSCKYIRKELSLSYVFLLLKETSQHGKYIWIIKRRSMIDRKIHHPQMNFPKTLICTTYSSFKPFNKWITSVAKIEIQTKQTNISFLASDHCLLSVHVLALVWKDKILQLVWFWSYASSCNVHWIQDTGNENSFSLHILWNYLFRHRHK